MKTLKILIAITVFLTIMFSLQEIKVYAQGYCDGPNPPVPCEQPDSDTDETETESSSRVMDTMLDANTPLRHEISTANLGPGGFDIEQTGMRSLGDYLERLLSFLTGTVLLIAILVFMIGSGFWIFSAGNESLVGRGKDMMLYSVIGLLLVLGAYVLVKLVQVILYALGT